MKIVHVIEKNNPFKDSPCLPYNKVELYFELASVNKFPEGGERVEQLK